MPISEGIFISVETELKTSSFMAPAMDQSYVIDASAGPVTVTFEHRHNAVYLAQIKKIDASSNPVILTPPVGHTFDGQSSITLTKQFGYISILHYRTTFYIIGWVPTMVPGSTSGLGIPQVCRKTANQATTSTTRVNATELVFPANSISLNVWYSFKFVVLFFSTAAATGIGLGISNDSGNTILGAQVRIAAAGDGAGQEWQGAITGSGDTVVATTTPLTNTGFIATVEGIFLTANPFPLQLSFFSETGNSVTCMAGSHGFLWALP